MGVNKFLPEDKKIKPGKMIGDAIYGSEGERKGNITLPSAAGGLVGSQTYAKDGINLPEFCIRKGWRVFKEIYKKDGVKGIVPGISLINLVFS